MHRTIIRLIACGLLLSAALALRAEPRFMGYFFQGGKPVFSLAREDGSDARWVSRGESFDGYKVEAFDARAEKLTLLRDGRTIEVSLNIARVKDATAARRAYLRTLRGLALAQELAKDGDAELGSFLQRRQQVLDSKNADEKNKFALDYLNTRIEEITAARLAALNQTR